MRVLLVDDHALFRQGLRFLLDALDDGLAFEEADNFDTALAAIEGGPAFDLVLMDFHMPGVSGLEALVRLLAAAPGTPLTVLSGEEDSEAIRLAIDAGASGFVLKSATPDVLVAALKLILAGGVYLPPSILSNLHTQQTAHSSAQMQLLSGRQTEVLLLAIQGKANKAIALELGIAEGTVKTHLWGAFKALGVRNRTEAVIAAAKYGLAPHT